MEPKITIVDHQVALVTIVKAMEVILGRMTVAGDITRTDAKEHLMSADMITDVHTVLGGTIVTRIAGKGPIGIAMGVVVVHHQRITLIKIKIKIRAAHKTTQVKVQMGRAPTRNELSKFLKQQCLVSYVNIYIMYLTYVSFLFNRFS